VNRDGPRGAGKRRQLLSTALLVAAAVAALALASGALHAGTASSASTTASVVVASVYDGDTLTLRDGRRIRLVQIDTPELGGGECYSRAARTALLQLAPPGVRVALETDPALDRVDRYGRLLRYIRRNEINVNLELVRRGAATPYFYSGDRGRYASRLMAAARAAKAAQRGLWKACPLTRLDPDAPITTGRSGPPAQNRGKCDPNYSRGCVPPYPPDLDCAELGRLGIPLPVLVVGQDPHRLDGDGDRLGCE
jgi:endonuclease YncB( thermonuclease family)